MITAVITLVAGLACVLGSYHLGWFTEFALQKGGKMAISENKMQIVIDNYFKSECDINTSIRSAFEKGFRIGVKKASSAQPEQIRCKDCRHNHDCNIQYHAQAGEEFYCGAAERRTDEGD